MSPSAAEIEASGSVGTVLAVGADIILLGLGIAATVLGIAAAQYLFHFVIAARPGRLRWRRRLPLPPFCGYLDATVVSTDEACLFVHAQGPFHVVVRHATREGEPEWCSPDYAARPQSAAYDFWGGLDWPDPIRIPASALKGGAYIVDIVPADASQACYRVPMLVRRGWERVVVVSSTNTWHAYNDFGGLSNYTCAAAPLPLRPLLFLLKSSGLRLRLSDKITLPAVPLPFRRPLANIHGELAALRSGRPVGISHLYRGELSLLRALDRLGIPYAVAGDEDVESFEILGAKPGLVIFNTHSEYWSDVGMAALPMMIDGGTSIAFFSGNNMYRRVERSGAALRVVDQIVDGDATARIIGAAYDALGYETYAGFRIVDRQHWVFAGCTDALASGHFGRCENPLSQPGRSGLETDKIRRSSEGFRLLAVGENAEGGACMVCRDLPGGAFVFNAASVSFTAMLETDRSGLQILRNLVARATARMRGGGGASPALPDLAGAEPDRRRASG